MLVLEVVPTITLSICTLLLAWVYLFYDFFLQGLKRHFKPVRKGYCSPTFSIIIPAYNEERMIKEKILNTLSLKYPPDKKEIIVIDDGSSDRTFQIAQSFSGIKALRIPRGGKNKAINAGLQIASGEVVIQTDADCFSRREDALTRVAENFADPCVGAVAAGINFIPSESDFITKFLSRGHAHGRRTWIAEGQLDSVSSGLGVFLAFRRELVPTIHEKCLADDVDISLQVRARGLRIVYEPELEIVTPSPSGFKVWYRQYMRRTLSGLVTLTHHRSMLFNRKLGWYGMVILPTRSLLVHLTPFFCLGFLASAILLHPMLGGVLTVLFLCLGLFSFIVRKFLIVQIVQLHALAMFVSGRFGPQYWMKEPRKSAIVAIERNNGAL